MGDYIRDHYISAYRLHMLKRGVVSNYGHSHIPHWDGGVDANGRHFTPIWPKIAAFALANRLDPRLLIEVQFDGWMNAEPPRPNHLTTSLTVEKYHKRTTLGPAVAWRRLSDQIEKLNRTLYREEAMFPDRPLDQAAAFVLMDPNTEFSPLFRVCIASRLNLHDVVDRYEGDALLQLAFNLDVYSQAWRDVLTPELLAQAKQLVGDTRNWIRQGGNRED